MTCPHHFILPPPDGPTVSASCRKCGAPKTWPASQEDMRDWVRAAQARRKEKVT